MPLDRHTRGRPVHAVRVGQWPVDPRHQIQQIAVQGDFLAVHVRHGSGEPRTDVVTRRKHSNRTFLLAQPTGHGACADAGTDWPSGAQAQNSSNVFMSQGFSQ